MKRRNRAEAGGKENSMHRGSYLVYNFANWAGHGGGNSSLLSMVR
jgi:hypothetical protein